MNVTRVVYQLARADFLERMRRTSTLVTLGGVLYAAYVFLPPNHASYVTLNLSGHRGLYNSAWVGTLVAMMTTMFLSFAGFYLVKNAVDRDRMTGVGAILAATPLTKPLYLLGKSLSNFAVLAAMVGVAALAAGVMQIVLGEDRTLRLDQLLTPFVAIALPTMALVAALAVLFEVLPGLRGGLGNVVYFFLWIGSVSSSLLRAADPFGMGNVIPQMFEACAAAFPGKTFDPSQYSIGFNFGGSGELWNLETFRWEGMRWAPQMLLGRLTWAAVGVGAALVAVVPFDRFDTTPAAPRGNRKGRAVRAARLGVADVPGGVAPESDALASAPTPATRVQLTPLEAKRGFAFGAMLAAELRLMLRGVSRWWYLVALGLAIACAFAPLEVVRGKLLPIAWVWPLLLWSALGTREARYNTGAVLFSAPRPLHRQLPAAWLAGVIVAALTGAGLGARLVVTGDQAALAAWGVGTIFIPAMALACGTWSGTGKLFEVLFVLLWYMGPMSGVAELDYTGGTGHVDPGRTTLYLAVTLMLLGLAWLGRRRQLAR